MTAADSDGPGRPLLRTGPNAKQFPQPTIFDSLQESGHDWMMIYNDSKHETYVESLTTPNAAEHTYNMDEFFHRAEHGTLPADELFEALRPLSRNGGALDLDAQLAVPARPQPGPVPGAPHLRTSAAPWPRMQYLARSRRGG